MSKKKEELTEMLINALENSNGGFDELKSQFNVCADAFEIGDDAKGLQTLAGLLGNLKDFSNFCADMISTHHETISEELMCDLTDQCELFQNLLGDMVQEMEESNFVEVGDILKYDLSDLITQMSQTFPTIAKSLKVTA
ncbi:MAG: hypothetical protein NE330_04300 [Lentisphaeraceae bacterium]|nr:hypothetical protein [Lentisphaeraceae bacterium]